MYQQAQEILLAIRQQGGLHGASGGFDQLAGQYPWYPTAWLGACLEDPDNTAALQKAALYIHHPLRVQWITQPTQAPVAAAAAAAGLPLAEAPEAMQPAITEEQAPAETMPAATGTPYLAAEALTVVEAPMPEEGPATASEAVPAAMASTDDSGADEAPAAAAETPMQEEAQAAAAEEVPPAMAGSDDSGAEEALLFQPYYTVDYFASQGIKVEGMLQQTNRFDRQLMSFTQWLKTMKKLNNDGQDKASDPKVDAQATASVVPKEVVTEAMAEVLLKQGKQDQAIALYAKLTLLHPEKSVFFASQIQKIKEQQ